MIKYSFPVSRQLRGTFKFSSFAVRIHQLISSKYEHTYIVGGAIRNVLLKRKITDVDITTSATPTQIKQIFDASNIHYDKTHEKFGVIVAAYGQEKIEVTTLRTEKYIAGRFPKVVFTKSLKKDSLRRDFTINALYYSPQLNRIYDFHNGLADIKLGRIRTIGNPYKRFQEDPLRIVRAHRLQLQYGLQLENKTAQAINVNKNLVSTISKTRLQKEITELKPEHLQKRLEKVIHSNA